MRSLLVFSLGVVIALCVIGVIAILPPAHSTMYDRGFSDYQSRNPDGLIYRDTLSCQQYAAMLWGHPDAVDISEYVDGCIAAGGIDN